jgi:TRAP-type C4-dicarboxylate transport system substrate-binding protein
MCVFLTPFLVRDYNHAYAMFNGEIGRTSTRPSRRSTR